MLVLSVAALGDRGTCDDNIHCRLYKPLLLVGWQRGLLATEFDCAPATHRTPPLCAPGRRRHQPAHIYISELVLGEDGAEVGHGLAHGWYLLEVVLAFVDDGAPAIVVNVLQDLGDGVVVEPVLLAGANPVDLEADLKRDS